MVATAIMGFGWLSIVGSVVVALGIGVSISGEDEALQAVLLGWAVGILAAGLVNALILWAIGYGLQLLLDIEAHLAPDKAPAPTAERAAPFISRR
jgi:hypothetical protein